LDSITDKSTLDINWDNSNVKLHHVPEKRSHIFLNKMLQKLQKNISTDGEVISKMKVASFFLGHGVLCIVYIVHRLKISSTVKAMQLS